MLDQFTAFVAAQARALGEASLTVLACLLAVAGIAYVATRRQHAGAISDLEARLKAREERLAEFTQKLSTQSPDEAQARIADLEARVSALTLQLAPRRLTDRQKVILRDEIVRPVRVNCSIEIEHDMSCSDCKAYAGDFCAVFAGLPGWRVTPLGFYALQQDVSTGLALQVMDPVNLTTTEFTVLNALQHAGVPHDVVAGRAPQIDVGLRVTIPTR
jgi:hypothetical protein